MGFILFLAVLYILKAAVIMLDRKSLIEKSQSFNISYHLPEAEMNSTPADAGVSFCGALGEVCRTTGSSCKDRQEDPDRSGKNGIREVVAFRVQGRTVFSAADIENGAGAGLCVPAEIF